MLELKKWLRPAIDAIQGVQQGWHRWYSYGSTATLNQLGNTSCVVADEGENGGNGCY